MIPEKPINKYKITIEWHLQKLKQAIITHYKDVNLNQYNFAIMDMTEINEIIENLKKIIKQCKEPKNV